LPNHGVIYSAASKEELTELHNYIQNKLTTFLDIKEKKYPTYNLEETGNNIVIHSSFLVDAFTSEMANTIFEELLFPDQAIYIHKMDFSFSNVSAKIYFDATAKNIVCNTNKKEAATIAEIAIAYFYLRIEMTKRNFEALTINYDWENLTNMQSEQYRKSVLK
jgi:arsenate reductase-like glutaredoxin family protein